MSSPKFFEAEQALFDTPMDMAGAALRYLAAGSAAGDAFGVQHAGYGAVKVDGALNHFMIRQRNALANGFESAPVTSDRAEDHRIPPAFTLCEIGYDVHPRRWYPHALDANAAALLAAVRVAPSFLATSGLVLAGGALLEAGLRPDPLALADVHAMCADSGFDLDFFVSDAVPFRGGIAAYRDALVAHLRESDAVIDCTCVQRGFACELRVSYRRPAGPGAYAVKMQIVDLGVAASPLALVQSFDIAAAKQYFCARTRRVVMTEDAAMSLTSRAIPYDRRFAGDPRYAGRLAKYLWRTDFVLALPDDAAKAALHVVRHVQARLYEALARCTADAQARAIRHLGAWFSELSVCDTATLAVTHILLELGGQRNRRGYGHTPRIDGCAPISGGIGRQGLSLMGARPDALTELFGMFQLFRILHAVRAMSAA